MSSFHFEKEVRKIRDIQNCYKKGLLALGPLSTRVVSTQLLPQGSVDFDSCSAVSHTRGQKRWDFLIGFPDWTLAVEIHSANGDQHLRQVVEKATALRKWLRENGQTLRVRPEFYFVAFGKVNFRNTRLRKELASKHKIVLSGKILNLDEEAKSWVKP